MRLEDVTAEIRPRAPWESIDLGCALATRHIALVWKAWLCTVVPLWILLAVVMRNHPIWFMIVVWWLKPIYARVPLFVLSRSLFGAVPRLRDVIRAWPGMLVRRFFFVALVGRFSPARGLSMPVGELEGLRGAAYRQRVALLERNGGEGAVMATVSGLMIKLLVCFSIVMFVVMMMPAHISERWSAGVVEFFQYSDMGELSSGFFWIAAGVWALGIMATEPFYVGAGFALYVNSRTLTEGWDIELAFKRLGARLDALKEGKSVFGGRGGGAGAAVLLAMAVLFVGGWSQAGSAAEGKEGVGEVLEGADFEVHYKTIKVPVQDDSSPRDWSWLNWLFGKGGALPEFFGMFGIILFWVILTLVVVGLGFLIYRNRHVFTGRGAGRSEIPGIKTKAVMGMDVTPESLPDDIAAAARQAWRDGDSKLALSLLYRGSIAWFVHRAELPIEESDTEGDCVRRVSEMKNARVADYFGKLTDTWIGTAYGKRQPGDQVMVQLCDEWPFNHAAVVERRGA